MSDLSLALMTGADIPIPDMQLTLHIPTLKEIAFMGESNFFTAVQYLCLNKEMLVQDEILLSSLSNFQVLMKVLEQTKDKEKKHSIVMLFKLLFPDFTAVITPRSIILNDMVNQHQILIDDSNFPALQEILKEVFCVTSIFQGDNIIYNPGNERAREIAAKLMKGRQKVAALKGGDGKESVLTRYISILVIGTNTLNLADCANLNMFQLFDLMERYNAFVEWDVDLRVRLAGGKPDKQVESWMRNIHSKH